MGNRGDPSADASSGDAFALLARRVRAQGVRVDTRLAILQLLASEDRDELRDELEAMIVETEARARDFERAMRD